MGMQKTALWKLLVPPADDLFGDVEPRSIGVGNSRTSKVAGGSK
jgi:hypothetical protein